MTLVKGDNGEFYGAVWVDAEGWTRDGYIKSAYLKYRDSLPPLRWLVDTGVDGIKVMSNAELKDTYDIA